MNGLSWDAIGVLVGVMAGVVVPTVIPLVVVLWKLNGKVESLISSINNIVRQHEEDRSDHAHMWAKHDRHDAQYAELNGRVSVLESQ